MSDHVRGYMDVRGVSHMFAVWTHEDEPDTENEEAYVWVMASQVQYVGICKRTGRTEIVFAAGGNSLLTDAPPTDVRWAIDYALQGGEARQGKEEELTYKVVYTE